MFNEYRPHGDWFKYQQRQQRRGKILKALYGAFVFALYITAATIAASL